MRTISITPVNTHGAIDIGLSCLGCIDSDGTPNCSFFQKGLCTTGKTAKCMARAMADHSEAQAEIVLAAISVMATKATSGSELRKSLPKIELVIENAAAF